jgi:hypothetical protein
MQDHNHLLPVIGLAILNGLFSPYLALVVALNGLWYPFFLPASMPVILMLSSLIVSTLTLMVGGVPAALYERVFGGLKTDYVSGFIWLIGVALLTLPATGNLMKAVGAG